MQIIALVEQSVIPIWVTDATRPSLLSRLRDSSDQEAWREFDEQYRSLIVHFCRRNGLSAPDAEDVRQNVMLSLTRSLEKFRYRPELGRFRDYLGRIVVNAARRHRVAPTTTGLNHVDLLSAGVEPEHREAWETEWMYHHLRRAMVSIRNQFAPRSLEVFSRLLSGRPMEEVAAEFDTSTEAVRKIKSRIRDRLTEIIAQQIDAEEFPERQTALEH